MRDASIDQAQVNGIPRFGDLAGAVDGDALVFDDATSLWVPGAVSSAVDPGSDVVAARVYATTSQIVNSGVWASAVFTNESFDTDGFHDNATNNTRLTIPAGKGGKYMVSGVVSYASDSSGVRYARILKNGVDVFGTTDIPAATAQMRVPTTALLDLVPGDYLELQARLSGPASLEIGDTTAGGSAGETWLSLFKIGSASGAMAKIAETELAAAAASITFSSIPATFASLRLVVTARSSLAGVNDSMQLFANGDTTLANYKYKLFYGTTITNYTAAADAQVGFLPGDTATANEPGSMEIILPHYAKTTFRKVFQSQFYAPGTPVSGVANAVWLNTAAINSLTLRPKNGTQFKAGTIATLYGMS